MTIERVRTGSPWEEKIGFARAVAAGDRVLVAGTMPLIDGVLQGEGDPYAQTKAALTHALEALTPSASAPRRSSAPVCTSRTYVMWTRPAAPTGSCSPPRRPSRPWSWSPASPTPASWSK